tara:strand:- start:113 stop:289 length:177 start_codon:yes stop_codon:yes gene_type:complete
MKELKKALVEIIAICFIWAAIGYGRPDVFRYGLFSKGFILQFLLVMVGMLLYKYAGRK